MDRVRQPLPQGMQADFIGAANLVIINELEVPKDKEHLVIAELYRALLGYSSPYAHHPKPILQVLPGGGGDESAVNEAS